MGEMEKKLKGISKMLAVLAIAVIIIVAAVGGAYWWFYLRPGPVPGISLNVSPAPQGVEYDVGDTIGGYAKPGEDITISGSTLPVVADATVTLNYTKPDGASFTRTTTTDSDGKFTDTYTSAATDPTGKWTVIAQIGGNVSAPEPFYIFVGSIKVGVIGPMDWIQGSGQVAGAILAAEEINDAGGARGYKIAVIRENDGGEDPAVATLAIQRLAPQVNFLMGCFRTECATPIKETAMDYKKILFICGSATTELIDCRQTFAYACGKCVYCDYARYKYLFRVTPPNSSVVFSHVLVPYIKHYLIPEVMIPRFGKPIKVAIVVEYAAWTQQLRILIDGGGTLFFNRLHPYTPTDYSATVVYKSYPLPTATADDIVAILEAIRKSGAQLIMHIFSAKAGQVFATQWGTRQIPAILVGVDVLAQQSSHWEISGGKCEYEVIATTPPRVNVTDKVIPFWDAYVARWGEEPIYTAFGTYDGMYILKAATERAGSFDSDAVVAELEKTDMRIVMGRFKVTATHDVFVENTKIPPGLESNYYKPGEPPYYYSLEQLKAMPNEDLFYITWTNSEYVRPLMAQWQNGEKVLTFPFNQSYTHQIEFPPWM